jgi:hypothetical protein
VDFFDPITINWKCTFDGGSTWYDAGISTNRCYVTLGDPLTAVFYTLVHLGCTNADGEDTTTGCIARIWSKFSDLNVQRVGGTQMQYWGTYASQYPAPEDAFSTAGLLKNADGRCGAWARFLIDCFRVQGITSASVQGITTKNILGGNGVGFYVKNWVFSTNPPTDLPGIPAQGNSNPESRFADHAVVLESSTVYDPSYGEDYTNLTIWEDASLDLLLYQDEYGNIYGLPNTLGDQQTEMNASP